MQKKSPRVCGVRIRRVKINGIIFAVHYGVSRIVPSLLTAKRTGLILSIAEGPCFAADGESSALIRIEA